MSQSHFTLAFPLKAQADTQALADDLSPLMPALFQAADTIGTIHYSRFTVLSERTLLLLARLRRRVRSADDQPRHACRTGVRHRVQIRRCSSAFTRGGSCRGVRGVGGGAFAPSSECLHSLSGGDGQGDQGHGRRRGRHGGRGTQSVSGDPANQIEACLL